MGVSGAKRSGRFSMGFARMMLLYPDTIAQKGQKFNIFCLIGAGCIPLAPMPPAPIIGNNYLCCLFVYNSVFCYTIRCKQARC